MVWENRPFNVYAGGTSIAACGYWTHQDPNGHTIRSTFSNGNVVGDGSLPDAYWDKKELDPDGKQTGFSAPIYYPLDDNDLFAPMSNFGVMSHGQYTSYTVDGINVPADYFAMRITRGSPQNLALDLLFMGARMSNQIIGVWRTGIGDGGIIPIKYTFVYDNSWSAINLISGPQERETPSRQLTKDEISAIKANIKRRLTSGCKDHIKKIIEKVGGKIVSTDVEALLQMVIDATGPGRRPNGVFGYLEPSESHAGGNLTGADSTKNNGSLMLNISGSIYDGERVRMSPAEFNSLSVGEQDKRRASSFNSFATSGNGFITTIHELIHLSVTPYTLGGPGADDIALAKATLSFSGQTFSPPPGSDQGAQIGAASGIWDDGLRQACGLPKNKDWNYLQQFIK